MRPLALVGVFALTAVGFAQPSPVVTAARKRQEALPAIEFTYHVHQVKTVSRLDELLADDGDREDRPATSPREVTADSTENRIVFAGGRVRVESNHPLYSRVSGDMVGQRYVAAYTGEQTKSYHHRPEGLDPQTATGILSDARDGVSRSEQLLPFTLAVRGLDEAVCFLPADQFVPAGTGSVRGRPCDAYRLKNTLVVTDRKAWFDPAAGYSLRRLRFDHRNGTPSVLIDVDSSKDNPAGVWLPTAFTVRHFASDGKPRSATEYTVDRVLVGKDYPDTEFDFPWPAGLHVEDNKTGYTYVARSDGTLQRTHWRGGPWSFWVTRNWWLFVGAFVGWRIYRRVRQRRERRAAAATARPGVTLIELLVVIAIIAILIGLTLAAVQRVRMASARVVCQARMQQLGIASHNYHSAHDTFPAGVSFPVEPGDHIPEDDAVGLSWQTALLPNLDQEALWQRARAAHDDDPQGLTPEHRAIAAVKLPVFRCFADTRDYGRYGYLSPEVWGDPGWALNNYLGVAGTALAEGDGLYHTHVATKLSEVTDGTSQTVMVGERPSGPNGYESNWYAGWGVMRYLYTAVLPVNRSFANRPVMHTPCPRVTVFEAGRSDDPCHNYHFWSYHEGGANFAFADGSVRFLSYSAVDVLPALATKAGGEAAGE